MMRQAQMQTQMVMQSKAEARSFRKESHA